MFRALILLLALLATSLLAPSARADAKACIAAHEHGQVAKNQGSLLEARRHFDECAADGCPPPIQSECRGFLEGLAIPTVVLQFEQETPPIDVHAFVDGNEVSLGAATEVDPGRHRFRFVAADGRSHEIVLDVAATDRNRTIVGDLRREEVPVPAPAPLLPDPEPPKKSGPSYVGPLVLVGVGGLGLISFAGLAVAGKVLEDDLLDECAPNCEEEDVKMMRNRYFGADVSLIVGGASLAAALVWFLVARSQEPDDEQASVSLATPGELVIRW
jgi:hypothetical protein